MAPFIFMACEKPNEGLGFEQVIGGSAEVGKLEFPVRTYTVPVDSQVVALSYNDQFALQVRYSGIRMVGSYIDPYFGKAESAIVGEIVPEDLDVNFGENPKVDSVRLYFRYRGAYGDTSKPMSIAVHQLAEQLSRDTIFYSSFRPALGDKIGGKENFIPRPNSLVTINGLLTNPTLSIPIDTTFIKNTLVDKGDGTFDAFSSTIKFLEYFKGLYVSATSEDGSILYLDPANSNSRMVIYYQNEEQDSLVYSYTFNQERTEVPMVFSVFGHDYSGAAFDAANPDSINGEERIYIQAMGGPAGILEIPGLDTLANSGMLVNEAYLKIHRSTGVASGLPMPSRLEVREYVNGLPSAYIPDFQPNSNGTIFGDGAYVSEELRQGNYRFELTRYVFDVLNGAEPKSLAVIPVIRTTTARRVILEGGLSDSHPVTLTLYYTKSED